MTMGGGRLSCVDRKMGQGNSKPASGTYCFFNDLIMAGVRSLLLILLLTAITESPVAACSLPSLQFFQPRNN
jgi:hypothetical protein